MAAEETIHVLLVEDDVMAARVIEAQLHAATTARFVVQNVGSLAAAQNALNEGEFEVIVVDLGLPDAFGLQALQVLSSHPTRLPCVVVSVHDDPELALAAVELGAQDFVTKGTSSPHSLERRLMASRARHGRLRREMALARELRTVFASLPDPHLVLDDQSRVIAANEAAGALYLRDANWLIGQRFRAEVPVNTPTSLRIQPVGGEPVHVIARAATVRWDGRDATIVALRPTSLHSPAPEKA